MADNDDVTGRSGRDPDPDEPTVAEPQPDAQESKPAPVMKERWRDRAWSFRAMLAVALASLVIGGLSGGVITAVAGHDHDGRYRNGPWPAGDRMPGWQGHGPRHFGGDGHPPWRRNGGQQGVPPTPQTPSPSASPSPGTTG